MSEPNQQTNSDAPASGTADPPSGGQAPSGQSRETREPEKLPDDHPLVTALERTKQEAADAKARLKQIEDGDKTEAQRLAEQVTDLQQDAEQAKTDALRYQLAVKHGLAEADLELLDTSGEPADVEKRAKRLAERIGSTPPVASSDHQGRTSGAPGVDDGDMNSLIRRAAGRQ